MKIVDCFVYGVFVLLYFQWRVVVWAAASPLHDFTSLLCLGRYLSD